MSSFQQRFTFAKLGADPLGLQLLYPEVPQLDADAVVAFLRDHPDMADVTCDLVNAEEAPALSASVSGSGPPASVLGLVAWGSHVIKFMQCDAPMPYGPLETCVRPALMPQEFKAEAAAHKSHVLLYYAGTSPDPLERHVALGAVAGALARFDAVVILNEEARCAVPALDLIPDDGEDILHTLRNLPIPYLWGGFVKLDVGDAQRPWARTFACHKLGLPNLARHLNGHEETAETFRLFSGILGYAREMRETFQPGEQLDFGTGATFVLRTPNESEWFLDSPGPLFVLEAEKATP